MRLWRKLNKGCVLLIAIPFLILLGLLLFSEWVWGGSIKPSLDPQYVSTAEYLFQHPQPTPSFLSVYPEPARLVHRPHEGVSVTVLGMNREGVTHWTRLFLNSQRISGENIGITFGYEWMLLDKDISRVTFVFTQLDKINTGLHLFRIQIGSSFNDFLNPDPKLSYEWAYRVE